MSINWLTTVKTYGGKRSPNMVDDECFRRRSWSQRKINNCYSFATIPIDRKWIGTIYRFQVIQTSRDPSLAISGGSRGGSNEPPLEPKLFPFHAEFLKKLVKLHKPPSANLNPRSNHPGSAPGNFHVVRTVWRILSTIHWIEMEFTLVGGQIPYRLMNKVSLINRNAKRTQRLKHQFFPFKTNGRKCDFDCPIHRIIKTEGAYFGRVRSIFWPKKLHNDFFWK